jgi:predicted phosphoribosyltransferase
MFANREEAGKILAEKLQPYRGANVIVLALPRGGVPVAHEIAKGLDAPLDIISVRKIGHPISPEYAIGAVSDDGHRLLNIEESSQIPTAKLESSIEEEKNQARRRAEVYRAGRTPIDFAGKIVIITDDGVATGLTMKLAVQKAQIQKPERIIIAVPVASLDAVQEFQKLGAVVLVLEPPEEFLGAVGAHYAEFPQLTDSEVIRLLKY